MNPTDDVVQPQFGADDEKNKIRCTVQARGYFPHIANEESSMFLKF